MIEGKISVRRGFLDLINIEFGKFNSKEDFLAEIKDYKAKNPTHHVCTIYVLRIV